MRPPQPRAWGDSVGSAIIRRSPEDFQEPVFRRLLLNAVLWSVGQQIPPELVQR